MTGFKSGPVVKEGTAVTTVLQPQPLLQHSFQQFTDGKYVGEHYGGSWANNHFQQQRTQI